MWISASIRRQLTLAIVLTALIPLTVALLVARSMVRQTAARFFVPEIGARLDQSLGLYRELARAVKANMRSEANALAAHEPLRQAAARGDKPAAQRELDRLFPLYRDLVSLTVLDHRGDPLAHVDRGRPVDEDQENELVVVLPLTGDALPDPNRKLDPDAIEGPRVHAVFAADRARFDELEQMSQFVDTYRNVERRREADEAAYVYGFGALLGVTIIGAIAVGLLLAGGVTIRIRRLVAATRRVGAGDLSARVPERGLDEITALAREFNRMVREVESNRARIEFLQRLGAWQEMARRLAHEIKNPLTPIQLSMQELHRRYKGDDAQFRLLLDESRSIVEDEVGTLRRLVSEFSDFARLPQSKLARADLADFLREQTQRPSLPDLADADASRAAELTTELTLPAESLPAYLDRQMLRRAFVNIINNAAQAMKAAGRRSGRVQISVQRREDAWVIDLDDDGPGIPADLRQSVFDPYVTTKSDGTGLGLAITKKIVMDHGGSISALASPLGGARLRLEIPVADTPAGNAALEASNWQPASSRP